MKEIIREFKGYEKRKAFLFAKSLKVSGVEGIKIQVSYDSEHLATRTKTPSKFIVYQEI